MSNGLLLAIGALKHRLNHGLIMDCSQVSHKLIVD